MVPSDWTVVRGDRFMVAAPNGGATLTGAAFRLDHRPPLAEFAEARYAGVESLKIYRQEGEQQALCGGGVLRRFVGTWPGEDQETTYAVSCVEHDGLYVSLALTTATADFAANGDLYRTLMASVVVGSAPCASVDLLQSVPARA